MPLSFSIGKNLDNALRYLLKNVWTCEYLDNETKSWTDK